MITPVVRERRALGRECVLVRNRVRESSSPLLVDGLARDRNSLNFLRLVLASSVILSHAPAATGITNGPGWIGGLGGQAVHGFFAVSGYLIAASASATSFGVFLWRRALRILPAFWVVLAMVAFVFAPLSTLLDGGTWSFSGGLRYVARNASLLIRQWGVEGTLQQVPYRDVWNGPLWSLFYEFGAYIATGLLFLIPGFRRGARWVYPVLCALATAAQPLAHGPWHVTTNLYLNALRLATYFLAGSMFFAWRRRVPVTAWLGVPALVTYLVLAFVGLDWTWGALPMTYALLWLGSTLRVALGRVNDISYGMYIYGFPMQQFTYLLIGTTGGVVLHTIVALVLTVPLAAASWFLLERPLMRLKDLFGAGRPSRARPAPVGGA